MFGGGCGVKPADATTASDALVARPPAVCTSVVPSGPTATPPEPAGPVPAVPHVVHVLFPVPQLSWQSGGGGELDAGGVGEVPGCGWVGPGCAGVGVGHVSSGTQARAVGVGVGAVGVGVEQLTSGTQRDGVEVGTGGVEVGVGGAGVGGSDTGRVGVGGSEMGRVGVGGSEIGGVGSKRGGDAVRPGPLFAEAPTARTMKLDAAKRIAPDAPAMSHRCQRDVPRSLMRLPCRVDDIESGAGAWDRCCGRPPGAQYRKVRIQRLLRRFEARIGIDRGGRTVWVWALPPLVGLASAVIGAFMPGLDVGWDIRLTIGLFGFVTMTAIAAIFLISFDHNRNDESDSVERH